MILFLSSFKNQSVDSIDNRIIEKSLHLKLDTLKVENIKNNKESVVWYESESMPWIISLLIAIITIGINVYIARVNQKTALKNVQNQIESSKSLALTQFKATLNTKNRQDWINEVRHTISDLLAQTAIFSVRVFDKKSENGDILMPHFEKIYYYKSKIAMLLNSEKNEQANLLNLINELVYLLANIEKGKTEKIIKEKENEIINASRVLFDLHWKKIKEIN